MQRVVSINLGGNWVLEFTAGPIETPVAFSYGVQASWDHVLAQQTFAVILPVRQGSDLTLVSGGPYARPRSTVTPIVPSTTSPTSQASWPEPRIASRARWAS